MQAVEVSLPPLVAPYLPAVVGRGRNWSPVLAPSWVSWVAEGLFHSQMAWRSVGECVLSLQLHHGRPDVAWVLEAADSEAAAALRCFLKSESVSDLTAQFVEDVGSGEPPAQPQTSKQGATGYLACEYSRARSLKSA